MEAEAEAKDRGVGTEQAGDIEQEVGTEQADIMPEPQAGIEQAVLQRGRPGEEDEVSPEGPLVGSHATLGLVSGYVSYIV